MSKNMTNMADQLKMAGVSTQNLNLTEKQAETAERLA